MYIGRLSAMVSCLIKVRILLLVLSITTPLKRKLIHQKVYLFFWHIFSWLGEETYDALYCMIDTAMSAIPSPDVPGVGLKFRENLRVMADFEVGERRPWSQRHPDHNLKVISAPKYKMHKYIICKFYILGLQFSLLSANLAPCINQWVFYLLRGLFYFSWHCMDVL